MSLEDPTQKITIYPNQKTENFSYTPIECSTWDIKDYYKPLTEARKISVPEPIIKNFDAPAIDAFLNKYKEDIQKHYEIKSPLNFYAIIRTPDTKQAVLEELNKLDNFFQDRDAARNIQEGNSVRIGNKGNVVFYYCPVFTNLKKFHIDFGVKKEQSILVPCSNMEFRLKLNYIFEFEKDVIKSKKDETTKIIPVVKDTEPEEVVLDEAELKAYKEAPISKKIIENAKKGGTFTWDYSGSTCGGFYQTEINRTLYTVFLKACNEVNETEYSDSGFDTDDTTKHYVIASPAVVALLQSLENFKMKKDIVDIFTDVSVIHEVGRLGRFTVYRDMFATSDYGIVGTFLAHFRSNNLKKPSDFINFSYGSRHVEVKGLGRKPQPMGKDLYNNEEENPLPVDTSTIPKSTPLFQLPQEQAEKLKKTSLQKFKSEHKYIEKTVEETLENLEKCSPKSPHETDELTSALKDEYKKIEENNAKKLKEEEERLKNNTFKIVGPGEYKITVSPNVSYVVNGVPTYSGPISFTTGSTSNCVIGVSSQYTGTVDENGKVSDIEHVGDKVVPSSIEETARKFQRETEEMKEWEKRVSNLVGNRMIGEDVGADIEPGKEELLRKNLKAEAERIAKEGKPVPINGDSVECASGLGITKKEEEQRAKENWKTVSREEFYGIPSNKGKPVSDKMNNYDTFAPVFQKDYITKERCFKNVGMNSMLSEKFKDSTKGFYVKEAISSYLSDETILLQKQNLLKDYAKEQFGSVNDVYAPSEVANMTVYKVSFIKHHILYENGIKFILSKNEDGLVFYGDKPLPEKGLTRFITKSYKCLSDAITDLSFHQKRGILVVKEISPEEYVETLFPSWVPRNDLRVRFYVIEPEKVKEEPKKVKIDQETGTTWSIEKGNKPKRLDSDYKSLEDMVSSIKDSAELPASYKDIPGVVGSPKPLKSNQEELDKAVSNLLDPACYVDDKTLAEIEKKTNESFRSEENK